MAVITKLCLALCVVLIIVASIQGKPSNRVQRQNDDTDELDPREICTLPMERGHCRALLLRWRYDPASKSCMEFKYGGCAGNGNNFPTKKLCTKVCEGI